MANFRNKSFMQFSALAKISEALGAALAIIKLADCYEPLLRQYYNYYNYYSEPLKSRGYRLKLAAFLEATVLIFRGYPASLY